MEDHDGKFPVTPMNNRALYSLQYINIEYISKSTELCKPNEPKLDDFPQLMTSVFRRDQEILINLELKAQFTLPIVCCLGG